MNRYVVEEADAWEVDLMTISGIQQYCDSDELVSAESECDEPSLTRSCILFAGTLSLIMPQTAFHASFKDVGKADEAVLKLSRGRALCVRS